jgi:hypothetical protein
MLSDFLYNRMCGSRIQTLLHPDSAPSLKSTGLCTQRNTRTQGLLAQLQRNFTHLPQSPSRPLPRLTASPLATRDGAPAIAAPHDSSMQASRMNAPTGTLLSR